MNSKSGLFLIELILAILFFTLASTVCVQMFVKSGTVKKDSAALNGCVLWEQNIAESFRECDGDSKDTAALICESFPFTDSSTDSGFTLYFDKDFKPSYYKTSDGYVANCVIAPDGDVKCLGVSFINGSGKVLHSLSLSVYGGEQDE